MTVWHAVVPIKAPGQRKTRLMGCLNDIEIKQLTDRMLWHVLRVLEQCRSIDSVTVLSPERPAGWNGSWKADSGDDLNEELGALAAIVRNRLLVIHADLPALLPADIDALVGAARDCVAIAPDRHGMGTNALAVTNAEVARFVFGPQSFACHRTLFPDCRVVRRWGLGLDVDVSADLAIAKLSRPEAFIRTR